MKKRTYYLIGIGGISMSGIALYLHNTGNIVLGSDIQKNEQTKQLEQKGIKIYFKQDAKNIKDDIDTVIYTSAVESFNSKGNIELLRAKKLRIKTYKRLIVSPYFISSCSITIIISLPTICSTI